MMAQSLPTALEPVTNISLSDECFVNLIVWLTVGGHKFGHRAENGQICERSPNKHISKFWNELNENLYRCLATSDLTHFNPPEGQIFGHEPKSNHCEHSPNGSPARFDMNLMKTVSVNVRKPQIWPNLAHRMSKYLATGSKVVSFLNTPPLRAPTRSKMNWKKKTFHLMSRNFRFDCHCNMMHILSWNLLTLANQIAQIGSCDRWRIHVLDFGGMGVWPGKK